MLTPFALFGTCVVQSRVITLFFTKGMSPVMYTGMGCASLRSTDPPSQPLCTTPPPTPHKFSTFIFLKYHSPTRSLEPKFHFPG